MILLTNLLLGHRGQQEQPRPSPRRGRSSGYSLGEDFKIHYITNWQHWPFFGLSSRFFCLFYSFLLFALWAASEWERNLVCPVIIVSDDVLGQLLAWEAHGRWLLCWLSGCRQNWWNSHTYSFFLFLSLCLSFSRRMSEGKRPIRSSFGHCSSSHSSLPCWSL